MALTKRIETSLRVEPNGMIYAEDKTIVEDDGAVIGSSVHIRNIQPGTVVDPTDVLVKAVAGVVHTPEVIAKHIARKNQSEQG